MAVKMRTWGLVSLRVFLLLIMAAYLLSFQTFTYWQGHQAAKRQPELNVFPRQIRDESIYDGRVSKYAAWGYEFELPWSDVQSTADAHGVHIIEFRSGVRTSMSTPNGVSGQEARKEADSRERSLRELLGAQTTTPNYDQYRAALYADPNAPFTFSLRQARRNSFGLLLKAMYLPRFDAMRGGVFWLQSGKYRGFQFGDPVRDAVTKVVLFDNEDKKIEFCFSKKNGTSSILSQAEINRLIQSLRPVSQVQPSSPPLSMKAAVH